MTVPAPARLAGARATSVDGRTRWWTCGWRPALPPYRGVSQQTLLK